MTNTGTGTDSDADAPAAPMGRRERKKAATRQAIADAALRLFTERGYDDVGIREIADAADVSTTTLFKHFPVKEALVFDEDAANEAALLAAVRDRPKGQSIPAALREHALRHRLAAADDDPRFAAFLGLVDDTPALRAYAQGMWLRHTSALAEVIADESGLPTDDPACTALAHFALEAPGMARGLDDPRQAITRAFALLENGWTSL
ncbi:MULTISPECIES: TetR/AcrR family transcriptional regulator [unclassified Streptomyces]|uniref:TetR/AcrR family transcriptional regulator n=1 Tax=unclassified Streptomyces TaxID=2593676 RepID=UPI0007485A7C|nr:MULTISPECIES: TetR/AcrR family transcriptional regulator [unclassified Streptomyces]KUL53024.1 TetR family transcriptional regulator [Streptomyces sp. NRRL S-1521]THC51969.1 TetR family transcriptional regulator [Streptomyces sp. A1499]